MRERKPYTQDEFGNIDLDPLYELILEPCCVCGNVLTEYGKTCRGCLSSLEEDRLERESNR